ncbi:FecR family protein [Mucilaginibacter sp. SP1R1]|uniref:FecR family protein n=1 Tax=Mucilaginibacter sp. SP1R1 TaxID=2723091 RepID=UPI00160AB7FD|nr:FecR family protein [Mucilaginibacter sp. SP1R1]MBB6148353.1 ferric-dicitrate binding protein FerR (iron transport regulator) [Mucilaginibacter sp. SP1R1]
MDQDNFIKLVTRKFTEQLSAEESQELADLLESNPVYQQKYDIFKAYFSANNAGKFENEDAFQRIRQKIVEREQQQDPKPVPVLRNIYRGVAAAAIIIFCITFTYSHFYNSRQNIPQLETLTLPASKKNITLSDGTRVMLNADSKLTFPKEFNNATREVSLTGEAFFDVHHDASHPFIIHTSKMDVKVLGTAFNIKAYPDDRFSETTLLRGKVQITLKDRPADVFTLKPSEKLIIRFAETINSDTVHKFRKMNALPEITYLERQDTTVVETSWMYHRVCFKHKTFGEISHELKRAYNVDFVFKNEKIRNQVFSGAFDQENISEVLDALSLIEPFSYKIQKNQIIIK